MLTALAFCLAGIGAIDAPIEVKEPTPIIFDTDMGNDVDDGFALGVIHALQSRGECELIAVTVTKDNELAAPFVDVLNTYYGRGEIPIGVVRDGKEPEQWKFLGLAAEMSGKAYRYPHDMKSGLDAPEASVLLRKVLAAQADHSTTIVQVGFSTNLARLLDTKADEHSPLNGRDLVAQKVKVLSVMAGAFEPHNGAPHPEYNVVYDLASAQKLAKNWPTPIVFSGFEIGLKTALPKDGIRYGYAYDPCHPMLAAYRLYNEDYHDQPSWDLTSVLWAVRPDRGYFGLSETGWVSYDEKGITEWREDADGRHRYLTVDAGQMERVKEVLTALATEPPHLSQK